MLQVLKQNSLLLDVASTKYQISIICPKLLSSPIPSMWLEKSSNCLSILTKFSQLLSFLIFVVSSNIMKTIPSSSGSVQAILNSIFTMMLIKKLRPLTQLYSIHTKYHGILARKVKVTTSWKWRSKLLILKETNFWTYSTMTIILLNHHMSKMDHGSKLLATQIHYIHATKAITNHTSISKYGLRFFPREEFKCLCDLYPIESRHHILHDCSRFNGYWNLRRDSLSHFVMFLVINLSAFTFSDSLV